MATITARPAKDGKQRFTAQIRTKGHTEAKTFSTKTAARDWARKREVELKEKPHLVGTEGHKHTLADALDRYSRDVLPHAGASIRQDRPRYLAWWRERYGRLPLAQVRSSTIAEGRDALLRTPKARGTGTLSAASVQQYLLALSHVLSVAAGEWEWLDRNPALGVAKPKVRNAADRYLSTDEIGRLLAACRESDSPYLLPVVLLALTTGARDMEIRGLRWRGLDFTRNTVTFAKTKNGETRTAGLVPEVVDLLEPRKGAAGALVFPNREDPSKPALIRTAWEVALRRAGIEGVKFHTLRHTAASHLAMSGATTPEIAAALGHKTLSMVKRYSHLSPGHVRSVTDRLAAVIATAEEGDL